MNHNPAMSSGRTIPAGTEFRAGVRALAAYLGEEPVTPYHY